MWTGLTDVEMTHFHVKMTAPGGDGGWRLAHCLTFGVHQGHLPLTMYLIAFCDPVLVLQSTYAHKRILHREHDWMVIGPYGDSEIEGNS